MMVAAAVVIMAMPTLAIIVMVMTGAACVMGMFF